LEQNLIEIQQERANIGSAMTRLRLSSATINSNIGKPLAEGGHLKQMSA